MNGGADNEFDFMMMMMVKGRGNFAGLGFWWELSSG